MSRQMTALVLLLVVSASPALFRAAPAEPAGKVVTLLLTADTEGHVNPCRECPHGSGLGGLARRATLVRRIRQESGGRESVVLLDAGNALAGRESADSGGKVIVEAYRALGYDAVNLTPGDFRLGRAAVIDAVRSAAFMVSANVLDESSSQPIARPYVVKAAGGRRVAVLGLSEAPAGWDYLSHLKKQLAGVRVRPPAEALAEWLPKAKAEADDVVLLYSGSPSGLAALLDKAGSGIAWVGLGGVRPQYVPASQTFAVVATAEHGKFIARASLHGKSAVEQIAVDDASPADPAMHTLLTAHSRPSAARRPN
jgi:2',3'-cyclic-nucleotide 2'-phosphodiesterase (5'-nucleotidase family)